jgi:hypothetical protein
MTEGDIITLVHINYLTTYFKAITGYRNIETSTSSYSNTIFRPTTDLGDQVILNYETNEYVPAYSLLNPARALPNISQSDFIQAMIKMYNLFWTYDLNNNTLSFYSYNTFYKADQYAVKIDQYIDSINYNIEPLGGAKEFNISYLKDEANGFGHIYSEGISFSKIFNPSIYSSNKVEIEMPIANAVFAPFKIYPEGLQVILPAIYKNEYGGAQNSETMLNLPDFECAPRFVVKNSYSDVEANDYILINGTTETSYLRCTNNDIINTSNLVNTYYIGGSFFDIKEILTVKMYIDEIMYNNLRLDVPVSYEGQLYYIYQISNWTPIVGLTTVKLMKKY